MRDRDPLDREAFPVDVEDAGRFFAGLVLVLVAGAFVGLAILCCLGDGVPR